MSTIRYYRKSSIEYPIGENIQHNIPIINKMAAAIKSLEVNDICLCCRGSSGAIIAGLIAGKLPKRIKVKIAHIKKKGENSHTVSIPDSEYIIIVDDFSITGDTLNEIYKGFSKFHGQKEVDCLCVDYIADSSKIKFEYKNLIVGTYETKADYKRKKECA